MFDIGWTELLVIAVVAVIVIGPKDLPRALRAVGHWTGKARRMAGDFQRQFNEAIREAELDDVKKHVADVKKQVADIGRIDPVGDVRKAMSKAEADIRSDLEKATKVDAPEASAATPAAAEPAKPEPAAAVLDEPATPAAPADEAVPAATGDAKP